MNSRVILFCALFVSLLFLFASQASATINTTLVSEDFSEGYIPPGDWSSYSVNNGYGYSYWSGNGAGGYNGSWVFDIWNCNYDYIYSPTLDLTAYNANTDKVTVEFDVYMEYNGNDLSNVSWNGEGGAQFQVYPDDGNSGDFGFFNNPTMLDLSYTSDYFTFDNTGSYEQLYDPDVSASSWRHYKLNVPSSYIGSTFRAVFFAQAYWNCSGGNVAIDNVVITAVQPQNIAYAPGNIDFGSVIIGQQSSQQCITITNPTIAPVPISSLSIGGLNPSDFVIVGETPTSIEPESSVNVCVEFVPTINGPRSAKLIVNNGSDNYPNISVNLTGIGLAPLITLIPVGPHNTTTKMFFQTRTTLGDTLEQSVLVENTGAGSLVVSPATQNIVGNNPGEYRVSHLPQPIPAGMIDTLRVQYIPTMEGFHDATLNIVSNAINGTQTLTLGAVGVIPKITVSPNPLRFDSTAVGDSVCAQLTITNPGSDTLIIKNQVITSTEGDFIFGLLTPELAIIPPDKTRIITVCFKPKQAGSREADLELITNIPKTFENVRRDTGRVSVTITGTGVPYGKLAISASGGSLLDSTIIGTQICQNDTIWNTGSADLTVKSLVFSGAQATEFAISGVTTPLIVKAKSYVAFKLCATPSARGLRLGTLTATAVTNEKIISAAIPVQVFGELVCASLSPNGTPLFDSVKVLKSTDSTLCVTVTNCGDVPAIYSAHISDVTYYSVTPASSPTVAPGQTTMFCIRFSPTASGELDSKLTVSSPNVSDMSLNLQGIGACANIQAPSVTVPTVNAGGHARFTVTINNTGNYTWNLGNPIIAQPDSAYWIVPPVAASIPPNGNIQLTIGYDPTKTSHTYSANLSFQGSGPCSETNPEITWTQTTGTQGVPMQTTESGFSLEQNYPNPTSGLTNFSFTMPKEAEVKVTLNSISGAMLKTLIEGRLSEGSHLVSFDASEFASGTYLYVLESEGVRLSRILVLSR
ncbi:MAG TPA: choice-of-anchor D domain-containing protein [Candidatus Kapabacteria bacterium]|nr:choice-of-anchor D domain-containing protein [Candidatus Kapabacteria bacterium]